jgi:ribosomal protein S18 acetylase RimI-like enzyme
MEVTVHDLLISSRDQIRHLGLATVPIRIDWISVTPEQCSYLYKTFGEGHWLRKLSWSMEEWAEWLDREDIVTAIVRLHDEPDPVGVCSNIESVIGYLQFRFTEGGTVYGLYGGVSPECRGKGIYKQFHSETLAQLWNMRPNVKEIRGDTSSLDSPAALHVYRSVGYEILGTRIEER